MKRIALIVILLYSYLGYSQKEGNNWVFAEKAGITFNYGKPVTIQKSEITYGGSAVISTPNGRLLYYSDGVNLFDSFHNSLGVTLKGTQGGLQNAMFVPRPDSANRIFIFTTKTVNGFNYSEIDTRLRSGRGDIVSDKLNIKLLYPSCGKITAVKHANRKDFWVVTHKYNSDSIYAYRIKSSGVDTIPVISKTGLKITDAQGQNYVMKVSPDGKKICSLNAYDSSILADFDAATGRVSNVWRFMNNEIGVEFSAKSKFLYTIGNDRLNQYNLSAKNNKTFINSRITIDTIYSNGPGLLQLGPDGKIYITIFVHNYLHAILFPDFDGERCIPQRNYVYLDGKLSSLGLPDMVQSFFQKKTFAVIPNCGRDTVFFKISNTYNLDSAKWDFGDTASGALNYSTNTSNVFHLYKSPGDYTSKLISYHKEFRDTIYETVTVNYGKPFLGNDAIICNSKKLTLNPKGVYKKYLWTGGEPPKPYR